MYIYTNLKLQYFIKMYFSLLKAYFPPVVFFSAAEHNMFCFWGTSNEFFTNKMMKF